MSIRARILLIITALACIGLLTIGAGKRSANRVEYVVITDTTADTQTFVFTVGIESEAYKYHAAVGKITISPSLYTTGGFGLSDSCYLILNTSILGATVELFRDSASSLPASLYYSFVGNDTLLKNDLTVQVTVRDTFTGTGASANVEVEYQAVWEFLLKEN